MNLSKFYIDGDWVDPIEPNSIPVINPASEESIGNVSIGSKEDVDKAVQAARNAFQSFSKTLVSERVELLTEIRNIYKKPSKKSEVTSQIIYGEKVRILEIKKKWLRIKTLSDNYSGFIKNEKLQKITPPTKNHQIIR